MAPVPLLSSVQIESLTSSSQLLHLIHHRNRNQHRHSKWYKHLSILRRNIRKLLDEVSAEQSLELLGSIASSTILKPRDVSGQIQKGAKARELVRKRIEERLSWMRGWMVEGCYAAFMTVVGDRQFASLGLVLIGTLARVARTIGWKGHHATKSLSEVGDHLDAEDATVGDDSDVSVMEDTGEMVARPDLVQDSGMNVDKRTGSVAGRSSPSPDGNISSSPGKRELGTPSPTFEGFSSPVWEPPESVGDLNTSQNKWKDQQITADSKSETAMKDSRKRKKRKGAAGDIDDIFSSLL